MRTESDAYMEQLTNLIISDHELDTITNALNKLMSDTSATSVMLLDKSGQVVSSQGTSTKRNATSLGALLAGAFSSSRHVAELLGEKDFRTIFQQGVHENIYTTMVEDQWLLVIVFVVDSQAEKFEENVQSIRELEMNLRRLGKEMSRFPVVMQWNKRDMPSALPVPVLERYLNRRRVPSYEAIASSGKGVYATLRAISKGVMSQL